jgi:Mg-chelatase subunit ChlD
MKKKILLLSVLIFLVAVKLPAEGAKVKVYLDPSYSTTGEDIRLTLDSFIDPGFPEPRNHLPVLFIHDNGVEDGKHFRKHWQQPLNGWPSFMETLQLPENSRLGIEPYYIDLDDSDNSEGTKNRSVEEDARKIKEAIGLILFHQDDPAAKNKKVVIIAYGSGAITARYYLKDLWETQNKSLAFHPVSEFIAVSPPNHGPFGSDPDFIEKLNGHSNKDAEKTDYRGQLFASEAPGSRRNNEPVENGILYVTLYPEGDRAKKNLAPDAVNIEVPGIPGGDDKKTVHQHIVHMPTVIGKALYAAVNHQAPPPRAFAFASVEKMNFKSPPIILPFQKSRADEGIVLLFDISGSLSGHLEPVKTAAKGFLELSAKYRDGQTNIGMAVFPSLPWNRQEDCGSHVIFPMTPVSETNMADAIATLDGLTVQGDTPLLNGLDTALQMFDGEKRKTIILFTDGNHNCPGRVNAGDSAVEKTIKALAGSGVKLYTVAAGSRLDVWNNKISGLMEAVGRGPVEEGMSLFADALGLQHVKDSTGRFVVTDPALKLEVGFDKPSYRTGDTVTVTASVVAGKRRVPGLTGVHVEVTHPVEGWGNWYALNKIPAHELRTVPGKINGDTISMVNRKAHFLTRTRKIPLPRMTRPAAFDLYDDGTHGDEKKGDGIYTNQYKDTLKEGDYSFRFRAAGDKFELEKNVRMYVAVYPDPDHSTPVIRWRDLFHDDRVQYAYDVEFIPRDRYGNYTGPGHWVDVEILYEHEDESGRSIRLEDNLDGAYSGRINIPRADLKSGVRFVFTVDGKPVNIVEKIPRFNKWLFGLHAGVGIPDNFYRLYHGAGISLGCNAGYRLSPQFSIVGMLGYNRFRSRSGSSVYGERLWWNTSINLKSEILKDPFRVYFNAGFGLYITESGDVKRGSNAGVGAAYSLKPDWVLECGADLHRVYLKGVDTDFLVTYVRLVHRF